MASRWSLLALMLLSSRATAAEDICSECQCTKGTSTLIDCTDRQLSAVPNASAWPSDADLEARFDHNKIVHITTLGSVPTLQKLSFTHCQLTLIDDLAFMHLPNLTYLDLSNNQLTSEVLRPQVYAKLNCA
jgi:Leucine rich repeat